MTHLLTYLVKLARDAFYTDAEIAHYLRDAANLVERGKFWPSDLALDKTPKRVVY